ncbi:MAG: GH92 family glycosyl hydrolase [Bacteroides sp.]|nr:GH92 family glycosyl hydrolase [Bacteroides sp.]
MKKIPFIVAMVVSGLSIGCASHTKTESELPDLTQYVDPYIGTGDHGHVFLGANVPFGLVQLGPTQYTRGWDWCSGYHYSDSVLIGFSHTHLSGTGIGELGDISLFPVTDERQREAHFRHEQERVRPGYYAVVLDDTNIKAELTATARTGFHRYTYPTDIDTTKIIINLKQGIGWDALKACTMTQENDTTVSGYRCSTGWAKRQQIFFHAVFSSPIRKAQMENDSIGIFSFCTGGQPLLVKVGLSPIGTENAKLNLQAENPGWDFEETAEKARLLWNKELNKIQVTTPDEKAKKIFYTALYHTMFAPSVFSDVNGDYRGADGQAHTDANGTNYTTFSLWDTYRAAHPLATLIHPERQKDFAQTMLNIFDQQGKLPVWYLMENETDCMVGNPGIPVLADIVLKGFEVDKEAAFRAMKASAMLDERSLGLLKEYGYIPYDKEPTNETTAKGLEYALADGCIAKVAETLGHVEDYNYFRNRSLSYRKYFDKSTCFMRGLSSDGRFSTPFDPFYTAPGKGDYTEGNAWQYAWLVPHDVHGLIDLFGCEERFVSKLDSLFTVEGDLGAEAAPDVSGLIGQYAHGNEPSHHVIYLYNYVGQPWKAAERLRQVMGTLYHDAPAGLCGNEDVGQMSAWYVLSAMGLYQVEPAGGKYIIGSPLFGVTKIEVGGGKTFEVVARNNSAKNIYIQSAKLNGAPYTKSYISFKDLKQGGRLELEMGDKPSGFGTGEEDKP